VLLTVALDPSVTEIRRGSLSGREVEGEVGWCPPEVANGMDISDSMSRADDAEVLRGIGMLEDLDGLELISPLRDSMLMNLFALYIKKETPAHWQPRNLRD